MYHCTEDDLYLIPTAEVPLTNLFRGDLLKADDLPIQLCGYTPCFRREAGSYGKDVRGLNRLHQFDKLELESFSTADTAHDEHLLFAAIQERLMQLLELPYQKLQKCTFDIGKPNAKGSDIEAWLPGQDKYSTSQPLA